MQPQHLQQCLHCLLVVSRITRKLNTISGGKVSHSEHAQSMGRSGLLHSNYAFMQMFIVFQFQDIINTKDMQKGATKPFLMQRESDDINDVTLSLTLILSSSPPK